METNILKPELLVPAGDFDCVRAGVQNGADCIYFGANLFSARASAKNFDDTELKEAIKYCKIRNVKTNLTLNTLLTDDEFSEAIELAIKAYEFGIDAIIVQDLGLAKFLIKNFPNLEIHASTQMSVHNLEGVLELEKLGFSRVVLSREVSLSEIEYIRNNCKVDLEIFIHGALCISYSGQCLFSSLVGGRSGNRGKCAQPCRLPYELIEKNGTHENKLDNGYILSPRDLSSLELLPQLVRLGINSFKIEGRMKTPDYVATVTKIYRKYIDLALSDKPYTIDEQDKKDLMQVFNRGAFSSGHLKTEPNKDLIFSKKSNNMGLYLGNISNYNASKGHITLKLNEKLAIGDTISIEGETGSYTISELMIGNSNFKECPCGKIVKIGRMKGDIKVGKKIYKMSSKSLTDSCKLTYKENSENKKIPLEGTITVKENEPITLNLKCNVPPFYNNIDLTVCSDIIPEQATNSPITSDRISAQIAKLGSTPYILSKLNIKLDENLHIFSISELNNLRRTAIQNLEETVLQQFLSTRQSVNIGTVTLPKNSHIDIKDRKISVLLELIDLNFDYSKLEGMDRIYVPLRYMINKKYESTLDLLSKKFNLYVYMPTILKPNFKNLLLNNLDNIISKFCIKGFVISNISNFILLRNYLGENFEFVSNYTMNIFNTHTINELANLGISTITPSVELNKEVLTNLCNNSSLKCELIAYGKNVLMNTSYCLLGKSNKCYPECMTKCKSNSKFYLKDRLGLYFRIIPDNLQTVTSIYNSKVTSFDTTDFNVNSIRINILDESIDEINNIVKTLKTGKKLEGKDFTNGNLNRTI